MNAGDRIPNDLIQEEKEYDSSGRVKVSWDVYKVGNGHGNHKEYHYDSADNLLCVKNYNTNGLISQLKYTYDANSNVLTKNVPLSAEECSLSELNSVIVTSNQYDNLNRLTSVTISCAANNQYNQMVNYTYEAGQLKTMTVSPNGGNPQTATYYYDAAMRLDHITNQANQKFQFKYYPGGQRKKKLIYLTDTDTSSFMTVDYKYDEAYLLKNLNYIWGANNQYYVNMGYNYGIYNGVEKIIENQIDYNINMPKVMNSIYNNGAFPSLINGSFKNEYSYNQLGQMTSSDIFEITPEIDSGFYTGSDGTTQIPYTVEIQNRVRTNYSNIDNNGNALTKAITYLSGNYNGDITNVKYSSTENCGVNTLNQIIRKAINQACYNYTCQIDPLTYDNNDNLISEHYNDGRPDNQYSYGLDHQLLWNVNDDSNSHKRLEKWYTYELEGKLLRVKSNLYDGNNPYDIYSLNSNDYFYYSHPTRNGGCWDHPKSKRLQ